MTKRDDKAFRDFAERFRRDGLPKIVESSHFIAIGVEPEKADVKMAVELGFAILLDKPLIVVVPTGRHIAEKLRRIADHVIVADLDTEEGRSEALARFNAVMNQ